MTSFPVVPESGGGGGEAPAERPGSQLGCLRLRGLPFTAGQAQLVEWFSGFNVLDALITTSDGKPNGQAFVMLPKEEALRAQVELNNKYMGKRFIEVFPSTATDMETARRMCAEQQRASAASQQLGSATQPAVRAHQQQQQHGGGGFSGASSNPNTMYIIRLRGLPFSATAADVRAFLAPIDLPEGVNSIQLARHPDLRPTGEAYVHLRSEADVMGAIKKHKQVMGKRYIEVFPSCLAELQQAMLLPKPGYPADALAAQMMVVPGGKPAAQAAWLAQQQQQLQLQQHMQLQAAAQQKLLASQQQQQALQAQAQLQQLQAQLQHMQLQPTPQQRQQQQQQEMLIAMSGSFGAGSLMAQQQQQAQRQQLALGAALASPAIWFGSAPHMGSAGSSTTLGTTGGANVSSSSMVSSLSGYPVGLTVPGGLAATPVAGVCSPSPLDVQYVPFFSSSSTNSQMDALLLQDQQSSGQQLPSAAANAAAAAAMGRSGCTHALLPSLASGSHLGHPLAEQLLSSTSNTGFDSSSATAAMQQMGAARGGGSGSACGPGVLPPSPAVVAPSAAAQLQMYGSGGNQVAAVGVRQPTHTALA